MPLIPLHIAADHPAFAGHFPGRPLAPGVLLLRLAQRATEAQLGTSVQGLTAVKFLSPVLPGEPLALEFDVAGPHARFAIKSGARQVATGTFVLATGDRS